MFLTAAALGGLFAGASQLASNQISNYQNISNAKTSDLRRYSLQMQYLQNAPKAQMEGYRSAGLNPILATNGGFHPGSLPSSASVPSASSNFDVAGGVQNYLQYKEQQRVNNAIIERERSQAAVNAANAGKAKAEADLAREQIRFSREEKGFQTLPGAINKIGATLDNVVQGDYSKGWQFIPNAMQYLRNVAGDKDKDYTQIYKQAIKDNRSRDTSKPVDESSSRNMRERYHHLRNQQEFDKPSHFLNAF